MALWHDVRLAIRLLAKGRWVTFAALVALAIGIGANVAVFTIFNAALLRDLPFRDPDSIVYFFTQDDRGRRAGGISYPDFRDYREAAELFARRAAVPDDQIVGGLLTAEDRRNCEAEASAAAAMVSRSILVIGPL